MRTTTGHDVWKVLHETTCQRQAMAYAAERQGFSALVQADDSGLDNSPGFVSRRGK